MMTRSLCSRAVVFVATIVLVGGPGCSDDDKPTPDAGMPDVGQPDSEVPSEAGTDAAATASFVGLVEGFGENGLHKSGVTVEIFDNETGKGTGTTAVSDAKGKVTFSGLIKGKLYGFKSSLANYKDTFVWNVRASDYAEETLWCISNTVFQMALGMGGLVPEAGKSVIAGAVYWVNASGEEEAIGCAKVTSSPATPDIRYMFKDSGFPTSLGNQPCTASKDTQGLGRFVVANLPPGRVTVTAKDHQDGEIGSTELWAVADSAVVSNIYATSDITANPTPATCSCTP